MSMGMRQLVNRDEDDDEFAAPWVAELCKQEDQEEDYNGGEVGNLLKWILDEDAATGPTWLCEEEDLVADQVEVTPELTGQYVVAANRRHKSPQAKFESFSKSVSQSPKRKFCRVCGEKICGFHYGAVCCQSCKLFFRRTVQEKKIYKCWLKQMCPVTVRSRTCCKACRFNKCLKIGMNPKGIREDKSKGRPNLEQLKELHVPHPSTCVSSPTDHYTSNGLAHNRPSSNLCPSVEPVIPQLLQEIMDVEPLWQMNKGDSSRLDDPDLYSIADQRLSQIVQWCKSLPLFEHISFDDQISLLMNSWCELLLFSCCYRSVDTPGKIRMGKAINGTQKVFIERMLNLTDHIREQEIDRYEFVAMKVIVLLQSGGELEQPQEVRASTEKVLQALQSYTMSHYPETPDKYGELMRRIPEELQRTCEVAKGMLTVHREGEEFNLLLELLLDGEGEEINS